MTDQDYGKLVNKKSKPSPMWKNMLWAFVVGGLICCIGQGFQEWYQSMGLSKTDAGTAVTHHAGAVVRPAHRSGSL